MKKIVITGASGFLGKNLIEKLQNDENYCIYALTSKCIKEKSLNVHYYDKNIIDSPNAEDIFKDAVIINCAYPRNSTGLEIADGLNYIQRLFTVCKKFNAKAVINISSQSVYSQKREFPADEETEVCLESPYAVGKYATELLAESIFSEGQTSYTNLRMASLIGPGFDQRIVNKFVKQAIIDKRINVVENRQKFGFLDISDAVKAIISLVNCESVLWENIYNLGNDSSYSLICIANEIKKFLFDEYRIVVELEVTKDDKYSNSSLDSKKFNTQFDFIGQCSLKESIVKIYDYYIGE